MHRQESNQTCIHRNQERVQEKVQQVVLERARRHLQRTKILEVQ